MKKPPPRSAMSRSTNCDEMLEPTIEIMRTPIVSSAASSGGALAAAGVK
jgi:hypothetical protein